MFCPICKRKLPAIDIKNGGYCPDCHAFTQMCAIFNCPDDPLVVAGSVALCRGHAAEIGLIVKKVGLLGVIELIRSLTRASRTH